MPELTPTWRLFRAKTDRSGKRQKWTRLLWAHLIDVANTVLLAWERVPPPSGCTFASFAVNLSLSAPG